MTNRKLDSYKKDAESEVYACKSNLKDLSYTHGLRNTRVVSSWHQVKNLQRVWCNDSVHLSTDSYHALTEAILEARASLSSKKRSGSAASDTPSSKKPRDEVYPADRQRPSYSGDHSGWRSDMRSGDARNRGQNYPREQHSGHCGGYYPGGRGGGWRGRRGWN